jgi:hypothetical protein
MKRAVILAVAAVAAVAALPTRADLARGEWRTTRPITLPRMSAPGFVCLPLDAQALAVKSLSEYRVVRDGRVEVPYRMVLEDGQTETRTFPAVVVSQGVLGGQQLQATVHLGAAAPPANRVQLRLRGDNFRCRARVEGSRDRARWWLLTKDGLVYRHEGRFERTQVTMPANDYRFLRVTLSRLEGKLPALEGVAAGAEVTIPRKLVTVPAKLSRREDTRHRRTVLTVDIGRLSRDLAELELEVKETTFDRPVTIEVARAGRKYEWAGDGAVRRVAAGQKAIVALPVRDARRLRIYVLNGDDRPLTVRGVTLRRVRRDLVFAADHAHTYALWYGRPDTPGPDYEIQRLPLTTPPAQLASAALGEARALPVKPPPPPPWSERYRAVFWAMLAGVIVLLGLLILRAMRGVKASPQG